MGLGEGNQTPTDLLSNLVPWEKSPTLGKRAVMATQKGSF